MNTTNTEKKHYAKRDPESQGIHYINHVSAMTTEGLHAKSAIAAELAHRDIEIERLRVALAAPAQAVPASVIMASVMRDDGGEHPAFCLMVAYRAEKDAKAALAMLTDEPAQQAAPAPARHPVAAPAQAGEYPPLACDYCGALTPDPWHSSGMLHGKMSKHIHSCDSCVVEAEVQKQDEALIRLMLEALECSGEPDDPGHRCSHCDDYVDRNSVLRNAARKRLEAVGAGGVEPLRKRECLHQIQEPDHFRGATEMVTAARQPLDDKAILQGRTDGYDAEDPPEGWAFAQGVRFAERAHGITGEPQ